MAGHGLKAQASKVPQTVVDAYGLGAEGLATLRAALRELAESVSADQ